MLLVSPLRSRMLCTSRVRRPSASTRRFSSSSPFSSAPRSPTQKTASPVSVVIACSLQLFSGLVTVTVAPLSGLLSGPNT